MTTTRRPAATDRPSIIVLGSINTDLVIRGSRLPVPGETVLGGEFYRVAGGKGANQAVAAGRLGSVPIALVAAVGDDDLGSAALAGLRQENLDCRYIKIARGRPTGVALILVGAAGENLISVAAGANGELTAADVDELPASLFNGAEVFLVSLESPLATVARALQRARDAGCRTILNPAPAHTELIASGCLDQVDLVTPNETEAAQLTGIPVADLDTATAAATRLCQFGCRAVVVTLGAAGCVVLERGEVTPIAAQRVEAVDTTAAGDAFNGALAVAIAEGRSLVDAARWATAAASLSVTRTGAQPSLPRRNELP